MTDLCAEKTCIIIAYRRSRRSGCLEILEGVVTGRGVVPVQDWARARARYAVISADPAANDAWMRAFAEQRRQEFIAQGFLDR